MIRLSPRERIAVFLEALSAEAGAARNTIAAYGRDLADFTDFAAAKGFDLMALDRDAVESWLIRLEAEGLAKSTRARRLSAVKQFYRFA